jgi:hypothetical protein
LHITGFNCQVLGAIDYIRPVEHPVQISQGKICLVNSKHPST